VAAWRLHDEILVSAPPTRLGLAPATSTSASTSVAAAARSGAPAIGQLAELMGDMVRQLEATDGPPLPRMVATCNAALEGCLEAQRDGRDREDREPTARDDLARLARLLTVVDRQDVVFVMRQLRRVLGRFDVCGA
jgi:hypothetical protein